jgi:hypothetical protein
VNNGKSLGGYAIAARAGADRDSSDCSRTESRLSRWTTPRARQSWLNPVYSWDDYWGNRGPTLSLSTSANVTGRTRTPHPLAPSLASSLPRADRRSCEWQDRTATPLQGRRRAAFPTEIYICLAVPGELSRPCRRGISGKKTAGTFCTFSWSINKNCYIKTPPMCCSFGLYSDSFDFIRLCSFD